MYEDMTPEKIRKRILSRLTTDLQTREGSFTYDVIAAAAEEISEAYHSLDALVPAFYVDETSGPYIDKQAGIVGVVRKTARPSPPGRSITRLPAWPSAWRTPSKSGTGPGRGCWPLRNPGTRTTSPPGRS